jgi:two-component system, cell cycle response regulator DivK
VSSPPPDPGALLVLVVDDDRANRKLAQDVLRRAGLRTIEAASGLEAIAVARELLPDVILLDLRLPDMNGLDVARTLGDHQPTAAIPVVALSGLRQVDGGDRLRGEGFRGYLEKPIDVDAFPEQVRGFCAPPGR